MVSQRSPLGFPSSPDLTSCLKENIFGWDGVSFDLLLIAWCFFRSYRIYWALWVFKKKCFLCCGWISVIQVVFQFCELTTWVVFDTLLLFLPGRAIQTLHSFALCTAFPESSMIRGFTNTFWKNNRTVKVALFHNFDTEGLKFGSYGMSEK